MPHPDILQHFNSVQDFGIKIVQLKGMEMMAAREEKR